MPRPRALRFWGAIPIALAIGLFGLRAGLHVDPKDRLAAVGAWDGDPVGSQPLGGSVLVARGGPLIIGFQSNGPARLTVASHDVRGTGVQKEWIIVEAGPLPIRFAGPPDARLIWSPVGRRGDPEYLPASSLSPAPPETATYHGAGADVTDGVIALLLLLVLVGSLLMLARQRLASVSRETWIALGVTFAVALLARWIGIGDQGQTWDEDVNWASGRNYVSNLLSLDGTQRSWIWNFEHPPVMKLLDGIGAQLADGLGPARLLSAIWISLGCALLVPIGARLARLRIGVLAALIAALLPPLVAHGQIVGHESPTVLWWSLGVLLALGVHDELSDDRRIVRRQVIVRMIAVGAAVGIAVASRYVNGLLGPLCVLIILVRTPREWRTTTLAWIGITALAAIVVFVAVWPRMWAHPIANLQESLHKLQGLHANEPFLGTVTNHPGPIYFLVYLAATAPLGILLATLGGLVRAGVERSRSLVIVLAWLVIPLGVAASPVRQDGVRYVMPCLLAISLLAALGIDRLAVRLEKVARLGRAGRRAYTGLVAAIALYLVFTLVRVHPFYLDYFGEQVGGAAGVQQRRMLETAWWGEGLNQAVAYVNEHARFGAPIVRNCILPGHLAWFRDDLWLAMTQDPASAEWIIWYSPTSSACSIPPTVHEVFTVTASGAVVARVYARN